MGLPVLLAVLFLFSPLLNAPKPEPAKFEDAVYVYSLFRGTPACGETVRRLKALPLRSTVILSVEGEEGFLLDRPDGESQLTCALSYLRDTSRWGKALFLQDPVFLERPEESGRRAALLASYVDRHPGLLLGAQVDLEPHTTDRWTKIDDRRAVMHDLHDLLGQVRQRLNGLPLGVAIPWWYPTMADEIPQGSLESLSGVTDDIYLMVYGGADGPVVGGTADRVLAHVDAPLFFMGGGRVHIVLATYEFPSPRELETEMAKVRCLSCRIRFRRSSAAPNFRCCDRRVGPRLGWGGRGGIRDSRSIRCDRTVLLERVALTLDFTESAKAGVPNPHALHRIKGPGA